MYLLVLKPCCLGTDRQGSDVELNSLLRIDFGVHDSEVHEAIGSVGVVFFKQSKTHRFFSNIECFSGKIDR